MNSFKLWLKFVYITAKRIGEIPPTKFVIFTHSLFLKDIEGGKKKIHNNGALLTTFHFPTKNYVVKRIKYSKDEKKDLNMKVCPSMCRINPCSTFWKPSIPQV